MSRTCDLQRRPRLASDRERGSLSPWMIFAVMIAFMFVGGIVDGAIILKGVQNAQAVAAEAARTGGQQLAGSSAMRGLPPSLDHAAAVTAAQSYITSAGMTGTVRIAGDTVLVDVADSRDLAVFTSLGPITVEGHGESRSVRTIGGVEQ